MALLANWAASSRRVLACSSWAMALATDGWNEPIAVRRSRARASSSWSAAAWMPVTARSVPSTEAATLAFTSSTLAMGGSFCLLFEVGEDAYAHAGQEYWGQAGYQADYGGSVGFFGGG